MSSLLCGKCGEVHAPATEKWAASEQVRATAKQRLPAQALGPLRLGREYALDVHRHLSAPKFSTFRVGTRHFTWPEYYHWLLEEGEKVSSKIGVAVTNHSVNGRRGDHNQAWFDRIYFDSDGAATWHQLQHFCVFHGIPAIFSESSSSVSDRTKDLLSVPSGDLPTRWHVEVPLAVRVFNPWATKGDPSSDPRWRHHVDELKRAWQHVASLFSAYAGFLGVGGNCGFDLTTSAFCQQRFLGTRSVENGPLPRIEAVNGGNAIDFRGLLVSTGFVPRPYVEASRKVRNVTIRIPGGGTRTRTVSSFSDQIYKDVKAGIGVHDFLQRTLACHPTKEQGQRAYYFCPVHNEANNPSNLPGGPNRTGFHVFMGPEGERWRCHGDCSTGGDVIHLAAAVWDVSRGKAAWELAKIIGLDTSVYLAQSEDWDPQQGFPEDPEEEATPVELPAEWSSKFDLIEDRDRWARERRQTSARQMGHVGDWLEKHLVDNADANAAFRAVIRLLVEGEREQVVKILQRDGKSVEKIVDGRMLEARRDPDVVAATVWSVMHESLTLAQAEGEVYEVIDALQGDKRSAGRPSLLREVGYQGMFELGVAMWKDDLRNGEAKSFASYMREVLRFDVFRSSTKGACTAFAIAGEVRHRVVENDTEKLQLARHRLAARVERFLGCMKVIQYRKTTFGRELAPINMRCSNGRGCPACANIRTGGEWDLILPAWKDIEYFYFLRLQFEDLAQVPEFKEFMRRAGRPNLCALGFHEEVVAGGKPRVTYCVTDVVDHAALAGLMGWWRQREIRVHGRKDMEQHEVERWTTDSAEEALGTILTEKLSIDMHLLAKIERAEDFRVAGKEQEYSEVAKEIEEFHTWAYRRQMVVSRSKRGLPWATKEQLKAAARASREDDDDLMPEEKITTTLVHVATGVRLGSRTGRPYTIDEANALMRIQSQAIRQAYAEQKQAQARDRARARHGPGRYAPRARARDPAV